MKFLPALLLLLVAPAFAQDQAIQRELIQRQQKSDAFNLQLKQSLERAQIPPGDLKRHMEFEMRHLGQRQRLENVSERQLHELKEEIPQELRPYERTKAEQERQPIVAAD